MSGTNDAYLIDFYGPTAHWYAITIGTISTFILVSNTFFIFITLTSKELRSKSSNWILVGFACCDFLHGSAQVFDAFAIWFGSIDNRHLCSVAGIFVIFTAVTSFGFPFLIAADRYYKITIPENRNFSLGKTLFSNRFIIPLIISWFCVSGLGNLPLLLKNAFGEDPGGFCGARKFTEVYMLMLYEMWSISVFFVSFVLTVIYYMRLANWLKQQQATASLETLSYTREIMMVTKIITLIPCLLGTPGVLLGAGQMLLPEIPMWAKRALITAPFCLTSVANPWLTICLVRPFRRRVLFLFNKIKISSTTTSVTAFSTNAQRH